MQDAHRTNRHTGHGKPVESGTTGSPGPLALRLATVDAADRQRAGLLRRFDDVDVQARATASRTSAPPAGRDRRAAGRSAGAGARPQLRVRRSRWRSSYTRALVAGDLAAAPIAAVVVGAAPHTQAGLGLTVVAGALAVVILAVAGGYQHRFVGTGTEEFRRLLGCGTLVVALADTAAYAAGPAVERTAVLTAPVAVALAVGVHALARVGLHRLRRRGLLADRVLAVGLERSVAGLVQAARRDPGAGLRVVGACVRRSSGREVDGVPVLGPPDAAVEALRRCHADTVVLAAWSDVGEEELRRLAWQLEGSGVRLLVAPRVAEVATTRLHLRPVGGVPLLTVEEPEFTGARRVAKGALDRGLAAVALVLLAPALLAVAVAVRLTSPGPVLYRQERVGRHGHVFRMRKFRTMRVGAEHEQAALEALNEHDGPLFKIRDDPRVTRVGRVLRRWSLDELPQLVDVLTGRMSMVGPRPPLLTEVARYEDDVRRRLLVKPGITGLWQVSGRSDLSWEEGVRADLSYVENWHLGLDLRIIARTVGAVLTRSGAY